MIIMSNYLNETVKNNYLTLFKNQIPLSEIILLEAEENYTHLILKDGKKMTVPKTLKAFEQILKCHNFYRIHRAFMINGEHLKSYNLNLGEARMTNNHIIVASRRRKMAFEGTLNHTH